MKEIKGDLVQMAIDEEFDVIAHGCNCFCNMGAGIAKTIKQHFPNAARVDKDTQYGLKKKLGSCSIARHKKLWIVNAYTQYRYGRGVNVDYDAIRKCMKYIKENFSGMRIGLPLIGCGLAGGDWSIVKKIIGEELGDEDITIVHYYK